MNGVRGMKMNQQNTNTPIEEMVDGVHWTESPTFEESFSSLFFWEKALEGRFESVETEKPEKKENGDDDQPMYPTAEDVEFFLLAEKVSGGSKEIFDLLKSVYTDDHGKQHVPSELKRRFKKICKKLLFAQANQLVYLAFSSSPEQPNICPYSALSEREIGKRAVDIGELSKKYQRFRDMVRESFAADIETAFPVKKLLEYNPLREGDTDVFWNFCHNRARHYLAMLLGYRDGKADRKKEQRKKRYPRDHLSRDKPVLCSSVQLPIGFSYDSKWDDIEEAYIACDIRRFSQSQQSKRHWKKDREKRMKYLAEQKEKS